ncbi:L,D-transpeptidase family protein [Actinoplanes sp. TBRC 11911]|uniref:L,D-transpeptidase family protein n=1 Tax=Actinoplanes sp. TBRC 11911 TaxID=2729386 RepID=UPI00145C97AD|nr:L,D-transpeptidase family protein [Actinoplanes sp. TBRC 11911]NMO54299.1 L,D-transpeptidase family protein [Actinoplanes sp. TBRC 11911]
MRRAGALAVAAAMALTLATGCDSGGSSQTGAQPTGVPENGTQPPGTQPTGTPPAGAQPTGVPETSPAQPSPSSTPPTSSTPAQPDKKPAPPKLKSGAKGAEVVALQERLTELGYWNGKADGNFGSTTQQAVFALQKAAGIGRDGTVGPKTRKALDQGVRPKARSTDGHVIEISLKRQLLMVVDDGKVKQIFNTSTGSNEHYQYQGETYLADTPSGRFKVGRQIDGWRHGPLGPLWRPKYFNGGIAVHGAPSVPAYPASHGCARVSISAMNWIWSNNAIPLKTRVWVY